MSGSICLTLKQDGGFFVLEAVRVQDYPKYNSEKRVGQIPGSTQVYRCTTGGLAQLTYISQVVLQGHSLAGSLPTSREWAEQLYQSLLHPLSHTWSRWMG